MSDKDVENFFRDICAYYRAYQDKNMTMMTVLLNAPRKKEQQEIKKEV